MVGMKRMFWKKSCAPAFSKWRQHKYQEVITHSTFTINTIKCLEEDQGRFTDKVSATNCVRAEKIIVDRKLANLLKAW